jgi:hypothetical protein
MPRVRNFAINKATLSVFVSCPLPDGRGSAVIRAQRAKLPSWTRRAGSAANRVVVLKKPRVAVLNFPFSIAFTVHPFSFSGPRPDGRGFRREHPLSRFSCRLPLFVFFAGFVWKRFISCEKSLRKTHTCVRRVRKKGPGIVHRPVGGNRGWPANAALLGISSPVGEAG